MKKCTALFLTAVILLSLLTGCGAQSKEATMDRWTTEASPMENNATMEEIYDSVSGDKDMATGDYEAPVTQRKLIRNISLSTETENMDALLSALDRKVAALGGYTENREVYTGSRYTSYRSGRSANLTVRIPAEKMDEFVSHVGSESNVISSNETSEDVTLTYVAVQSRMTALQKEEARLLELIDKAANLSELLELEKRLTQIRTELESVTSQLLLYDNLVDFGTIRISIQEVQTLTPVEEPGFGSRIATGFTDNLESLWDFLKESVIFLVTALPYLVPITLIGVALIIIFRRSLRKKKKAESEQK